MGDALVLLTAAAPDTDVESMAELLAMLTRRHFVRTSLAIQGDLVEAVRAQCIEQGVGARLTLEQEHLASHELRTLVTARPHAHLALSIVAERSGRFTADAIGTVLDAGLTLYVKGRPILLDNVQGT